MPRVSDASLTPFGKQMGEHFNFKPGWRNLNHGSFGSAPKDIIRILQHYQNEAEEAPDIFFRYTYSNLLLRSRQSAASFLQAPLNSVVFVQNATTGINVVLRNLSFTTSDHIIIFSSVIYEACNKTVNYVSEITGAKVTSIPITYPFATNATILAAFCEAVDSIRAVGENPKLALFDTVASKPAVRLPFESLIKCCREKGVLSLVDGAHGAGLVPLNLSELDPDFFVTNLHKWLFVPRVCAAFYVPERNQKLIRSTLPTSWGFVPSGESTSGTFLPGPEGYTQNAFEALFEDVGTLDISAYFCVPEAIRWRENVCGGEEKIMQYCAKLAERGASIVANILSTAVLENEEAELGRDLAMQCVRLPIKPGNEPSKTCSWLDRCLIENWGTFVSAFKHGNALWVRLSAQVYLDESDFEYLGKGLRETCNMWDKLTV